MSLKNLHRICESGTGCMNQLIFTRKAKLPTVLEALAERAAESDTGTVPVPATAISMRSLVVLTIWRQERFLH